MRFIKFNLVGALGVIVQLGVLWALIHVMNYAAAAVLAVTTAVLHNFAWHWHWTWPDRRRGDHGMTERLARFAITNGVVSLAGNTVVMLVLVGGARLGPLPANLVAIAVCGVLNFSISDRLVFRDGEAEIGQNRAA